MKIHLSIQSHSNKSGPLTLYTNTLIGRGSDCKLKLNSDLVSRHHCKIYLTDSVALVQDLGSSNGTFIDGQKLTPHRDTKLDPGCLLSIANVNFRVDYDTQDFFESGSTVNLKGIEAIFPKNPHKSNPEKDIELSISEDSTQSEGQIKPEKNKSSETVSIDEYDPDLNIKQNKRTVQFPEIELTDKLEEE